MLDPCWDLGTHATMGGAARQGEGGAQAEVGGYGEALLRKNDVILGARREAPGVFLWPKCRLDHAG